MKTNLVQSQRGDRLSVNEISLFHRSTGFKLTPIIHESTFEIVRVDEVTTKAGRNARPKSRKLNEPHKQLPSNFSQLTNYGGSSTENQFTARRLYHLPSVACCSILLCEIVCYFRFSWLFNEIPKTTNAKLVDESVFNIIAIAIAMSSVECTKDELATRM